MKTLITIALGLSIGTSVFAANVDRVIRRANNVVTLLERRADDLSQREVDLIAQKLEEITQIISGRTPNPTPRPPTYGQVIHQAECWIDDDPDFDFGQRSAGVVKGTIQQIVSECEFRGHSTYPNGSAGLKDLVAIDDTTGYDKYECHVDDDLDFDFGQDVIGNIYGNSSRDATEACAAIARMMYGDKGSSGIRY